MFYVADTHALIWYIIGRLPDNVNKIFKDAETGGSIIFVPTIVLAECKYLVKNKKVELDYPELLRKLEISKTFIPVSFDFEVLKIMEDKTSDIHDQIIIATSKLLNAKIITKDKEMQRLAECIWG